MSHDGGQTCLCVRDHNPNPMELHIHHVHPLANGGSDTDENRVWLCPTAHVNVHELMRFWFRAGGRPAWEIERRYSAFVRDLAQRGYEASVASAL